MPHHRGQSAISRWRRRPTTTITTITGTTTIIGPIIDPIIGTIGDTTITPHAIITDRTIGRDIIIVTDRWP
ncbi:hypothetical protein GCM10007874_71860 [Labrys miyagiensis]|uniref:Uncharacterized protein n=1 Tax=Labrys miyagiensis TaxID=346912 RepID=A0ABQ6CWQ0_9HYPH|nr:hypothetical protein GCM10007874_71860 [Labrys miyagiensis]